jgi:hypothetical protein
MRNDPKPIPARIAIRKPVADAALGPVALDMSPAVSPDTSLDASFDRSFDDAATSQMPARARTKPASWRLRGHPELRPLKMTGITAVMTAAVGATVAALPSERPR